MWLNRFGFDAFWLPTKWRNHIQPTGLTKVRYFGGWSGNKAAAYKTLCEDLLPSTTDRLLASVLDEANQPHKPDIVCEHCGSDRLVLVEHTAKPSWRDLLGYSSAHVPWWYKEARNEDDQRFWDGAMGAGFNDWYLETLVESAKEPEPSESPPKQAWLMGFETIRMASEYPLNSF